MVFSLLTVHRTNADGTIDGAWLQDVVGTPETARERALKTSALNSGMPVAIVKAVGWCSPGDIFYAQKEVA
jgi:hypothetical protein